MLTKNDIANLRYLIWCYFNRRYHSSRSTFRRLRRRVKYAVKNGHFPEKLDPKDPHYLEKVMFPIVRNTFPTSIKGEIMSEMPIKIDPAKVTKEPYEELVIQGGLVHEFINGFTHHQWKLVYNKGVREKREGSGIVFAVVSESRVIDALWPSWRVDLPESKRHKWEAQIRAFDATQRMLKGVDEINASLHEALSSLQ